MKIYGVRGYEDSHSGGHYWFARYYKTGDRARSGCAILQSREDPRIIKYDVVELELRD